MILAFEFQYISQNGVLQSLLEEICVDFNIPHVVVKDASMVTLFVEDNEQRIGDFADVLSASLPLSLFFKSSSVYVAQTLPTEPQECIDTTLKPFFTPKILSSIETPNSPMYLLPYTEFVLGEDSLCLRHKDELLMSAKSSEDFETLYAKVAQAMIDGQTVSIPTHHHSYVFGKVDLLSTFKNLDGIDIVATDLSVVEKMVVIKENEIKALASLERPSLRLKINALYAQKEILPVSRIRLRLADELIIFHLCKRLFEKGVGFIFKADAHLIDADMSIDFTGTLPNLEPLEVTVLDNGEIAIVEGSSYASPLLKANLTKFEEPCFRFFASIMQEHQLFSSNTACFYLSCFHDDAFMHYSLENRMLTFSRVTLPSSMEALFSEIALMGKSGARLLENYKEAFPEIYERALHVTLPETMLKSIFSLWKIAAIVLGLTQDLESAAQTLIENAEDFGGQKGPRIDYYLQKEEALVSDFNYLKLIRSGMSFKLAGTDDATLSFGYMQSLAYFLSDTSDYYKENVGIENVALAGSLFKYRKFTEMVYKNLKPNHTLRLNRELPIDDKA
jgi:hypothetical protein